MLAEPAPYYKRTPETLQAICDALEAGCTRRAAAWTAGISHDCFYQWIASDSDAADAISRAEAKSEAVATRRVTSAFTDGDSRVATQNAQWWLERRRRADYGPSLDLGKVPTDRLLELLAGAAAGTEPETATMQSLRKQELLATVDRQEAERVEGATEAQEPTA